jgi:hypothetical protein
MHPNGGYPEKVGPITEQPLLQLSSSMDVEECNQVKREPTCVSIGDENAAAIMCLLRNPVS